jgi:hypothetical protein
MNEKEDVFKEINSDGIYELDLPEFYKALKKAIINNNIQSIYGLSKTFARYCFKKLES